MAGRLQTATHPLRALLRTLLCAGPAGLLGHLLQRPGQPARDLQWRCCQLLEHGPRIDVTRDLGGHITAATWLRADGGMVRYRTGTVGCRATGTSSATGRRRQVAAEN